MGNFSTLLRRLFLRQAERRVVVTWTPAAVERVRQVMPKNPKSFVRVGVVIQGEGFIYSLDFDETIDLKGDYVDESHGIKAVVSKRWSPYLVHTEIGWKRTPEGREGFTFDNPNVSKL